MAEIHVYECDGPGCDVRRQLPVTTSNAVADAVSALTAWGQRNGWKLANIDGQKLGFHAWSCLVAWVAAHGPLVSVAVTDGAICENRPGGQGGNGPGGPSGTRPGGGSNPGGNPPPAGPGRPKG